jgi:hypothetical protein
MTTGIDWVSSVGERVCRPNQDAEAIRVLLVEENRLISAAGAEALKHAAHSRTR